MRRYEQKGESDYLKIGSREFDFGHRSYIMGILNVTPDSFSDGGSYTDRDSILKRAEQMVCEGADILDIGGESTRPGYTRISDTEEMERVLPALDWIRAEMDIPLSVDTYKSRVAREALWHGAHMINDIWGLKKDPQMAAVIARAQAFCVLMHNGDGIYQDLIGDCIRSLQESVQLARLAGISEDKIILDPGIGFAKTYEQNLQILNSLGQFRQAGYPLLLGCSRKSVIGLTLNLPADQRLEGTLVTTALAVMAGYAFVRVHDVAANKRALLMAQAIRDVRMQ